VTAKCRSTRSDEIHPPALRTKGAWKTLATSVIALELAASGRERTKTADNRFKPEVPVME
jgi:hypothetical protein